MKRPTSWERFILYALVAIGRLDGTAGEEAVLTRLRSRP
jgi:hypothetical protein